MDDVDRAQAQSEMHLATILERHRARFIGPRRNDCCGCGDEIPAERRAAVPGCALCLDCQIEAERNLGR